ncbi:MAG: ABC transporter substrate-binding protein [Enterocloster aldenensis]
MKRKKKQLVSFSLAAAMVLSLAACGSSNQTTAPAETADLPTIDAINLGEDYKELKASIKILTDRTDIVDTVYRGYAEEFMKLYPNIQVTYEGITDYTQAMTLRIPTGDWGDICYIPTSVNKDELGEYFIPLGDYQTLNQIYNFCSEKSFDGKQYGIANGGVADGIVYNRSVWEAAGITEMPKTPDQFLDCLQKIKDNTDAVPLYSNFSAGWTMGAWDAYITVAATGDSDFKNNTMVHTKNPFAKREDMTGPYAVYYVLYEAVKRGLVEEDPASSDWESSKGMMNRGDIGNMVLGSWAVNQCKDAGSTPEDVAYMPFPITVNGKQYAGAGGNYSYGINNKASADNQIASMLYLKWILDESSMFVDEGSIPARKDAPMPDVLADFTGVELLSNSPAKEGEETFFDDVNSKSEVGIQNNDYPDCEILEAALYQTKTLDEIMDEWNQKWSAAQEALEIEVTE